MIITINKKKITLKYSLRAMVMFENMTEKSFNPQGITDILTFMYCIVVSSAKDYSITFDDFMDAMDKNPNLVNEFAKWLTDTSNTQADFTKN